MAKVEEKQKLEFVFDEDERRYYITQKSAERLIGQIKEIQARHEHTDTLGQGPTWSDSVSHGPTMSEDVGQGRPVADREERETRTTTGGPENDTRIKELEYKLRDAEITSRAKDMFIDQLKADRENFVKEREGLITKLVESTKRIGSLETQLLQLEGPKNRTEHVQPSGGEVYQSAPGEYREGEAYPA